MPSSTAAFLCLCLCLLLCGASLGAVDHAIGWRGDGTGIFPGQKPPTTWNDSSGIAWRVPVPNWSNSSPVVADGRVFLTSEPREAWPFSAPVVSGGLRADGPPVRSP